jgi:hypothetical protein
MQPFGLTTPSALFQTCVSSLFAISQSCQLTYQPLPFKRHRCCSNANTNTNPPHPAVVSTAAAAAAAVTHLQISKWGFDIDSLDSATNGRPLAALMLSGLKSLNLFESCNLQEDKVLHWALDVERQYLGNPFHDHKHAADVLQTVLSVLLMVSTAQPQHTKSY